MANYIDPSELLDSGSEFLDGENLLDINWQTTAAVGLTVASGGVLGCLSLAAFPAQTIGAVGGIGLLAYAGKNRADGKDAFPFLSKSDKTEDKPKSDAKADPKVKAEAKSEEKSEEKAEA